MDQLNTWMRERNAGLKSQQLARSINPALGCGAVFEVKGEKWLNFASNDYRGVLTKGVQRDEDAAGGKEACPLGICSSRVVVGTSQVHLDLENKLAEFFQAPSALVFSSGYLANIGLLSAIVSRLDTVFADKLIHASLLDGVHLSKASLQRFQHNDLQHLETLLKKFQCKRRASAKFFIIVESVYSMDGDLAPLEELIQLAQSYQAFLIVDEAHAIGVYGDYGRGRVAELAVQDQVSAVLGTMSKAMAAYGGFCCGQQTLKDFLINTSRPFIYNTALPPIVVRSAVAALKRFQSDRTGGEEVIQKADVFRSALQHYGFDTFDSSSHIIPVRIGGNERTLQAACALRRERIEVLAVRSPTVPKGSERLRFSISSGHEESDLKKTAEILSSVAKEQELI